MSSGQARQSGVANNVRAQMLRSVVLSIEPGYPFPADLGIRHDEGAGHKPKGLSHAGQGL